MKRPSGRSDHSLPPGEAGERRQDPVADLDVTTPGPTSRTRPTAFIADDGRKRGRIAYMPCASIGRGIDRGKFDVR